MVSSNSILVQCGLPVVRGIRLATLTKHIGAMATNARWLQQLEFGARSSGAVAWMSQEV